MTCRHAAAVDASVGVGPAPGVAPEVVTPDVVAHVVARLHPFARADVSLASLTTLTYLGDELQSITYSEPAAALLPQAHKTAGA